jgi:predicted small secreted protein
MKKKMLIFMAVATVCVFLTGCDSSTPRGTDQAVKEAVKDTVTPKKIDQVVKAIVTPKGTDQAVKDTVLKIAKEKLRDQLTPSVYYQLSDGNIPLANLKITYMDLKGKYKLDRHADATVAGVDKIMANVTMSLRNIRTKEINNEIKMSRSAADLFANQNKVSIEYTAQLNSEGQVYVEVFGLKF